MEAEKYLELIIKQRQGKLSSDEQSLLNNWLKEDSENQKIYNDLYKVWDVTKHYQESYTPNTAAGFERFQNSLVSSGQTLSNTPPNIQDDATKLIIKKSQGNLSTDEATYLNKIIQDNPQYSTLEKEIPQVWKLTEQYQQSYTPNVAAGLSRFQQSLSQMDQSSLVESNEEYYSELIIQKLNNSIDANDETILNNWLAQSDEHYKLFEEITQVWSSTEHYQESYEPDVASGLAKFQQLISEEPVGIKETPVKSLSNKPNRRFGMLGVAAAIALLLVTGYWVLFNQSSSIEIATKEQTQTITLPDGSKVSLNENSILSYNKKFEKRVVNLKGEAFFEVTKRNGQPFSIFSNGTKTEVLGTSFNIKTNDENKDVEVTVVTGKVAVSLAKIPQKKVLLTSGDKAVYKPQAALIKKEKSNDKNFLAWKTHVLSYENKTLKEIIPELENFYKIKILVSNQQMLNCRFTVDFDNISTKEALKVITFSLNASFKKSGNQYTIEGTGCNE